MVGLREASVIPHMWLERQDEALIGQLWLRKE